MADTMKFAEIEKKRGRGFQGRKRKAWTSVILPEEVAYCSIGRISSRAPPRRPFVYREQNMRLYQEHPKLPNDFVGEFPCKNNS